MDEADRMLSMDFENEMDQLLRVIPRERVTMLFSATMTSKVRCTDTETHTHTHTHTLTHIHTHTHTHTPTTSHAVLLACV